MCFAVRLALLTLFSILLMACAYHSSFNQGIACFRSKNYREAFIHLKPEAIRGQPDAQYAVGYMYYYGQGVIENRRQAWYWINRAAAAGQPEAVEATKILREGLKTVTLDPFDPLIYKDPSEL